MSAVPQQLPDAEALVIQFLLGRSELDADIAGRVYGALPADPAFPAIRVVRWGGTPIIGTPLVLDAPDLQVDVWGGGKTRARWIAEECRRLITAYLPGVYATGVVSSVVLGLMSYAPDTTMANARPRYLFDLTVRTRPRRRST